MERNSVAWGRGGRGRLRRVVLMLVVVVALVPAGAIAAGPDFHGASWAD